MVSSLSSDKKLSLLGSIHCLSFWQLRSPDSICPGRCDFVPWPSEESLGWFARSAQVHLPLFSRMASVLVTLADDFSGMQELGWKMSMGRLFWRGE